MNSGKFDKRGIIFGRIPRELKEVFAKKLKVDGVRLGEFIEACVRLYIEEKTFQEKVMRKVKEMRLREE